VLDEIGSYDEVPLPGVEPGISGITPKEGEVL
jgi:hypothetical protein